MRPQVFNPVIYFIVSLCCSSLQAQNGYGSAVGGLPSWPERQILVLTNACRMAPTQYRDRYVGNYAILDSSKYPAVVPVYWNLSLSKSAHAHALDMGDTCGILQHNSCNGTAWNTRIASFYSNNSWIGENIAYGNSSPITTMNQWILDMQSNNQPAGDLSWSKVAGSTDSSRQDGHRWNIMFKTYRELGAGYAYGNKSGSTKHYFWDQDFGGGAPTFTNPIVSASHFLIESGKTTFLANYYDPSGLPPSSASLVLAGQKSAMTLSMGISSRGTYQLTLARLSACRPYYFTFVDNAGKVWRYPETGSLITTGEGSCTQEYSVAETLSIGLQSGNVPVHQNLVKSMVNRQCISVTIENQNAVPQSIVLIDCRGKTVFDGKWNTGSVQSSATNSQNFTLPKPLSHGLYFAIHRFSNSKAFIEKCFFE